MGGPSPDPNAPPPDQTDPSQGQGFGDPFSGDPFNPVSPSPSMPFFGGGGTNAPTAPQNVIGTPYDPAIQSQQQGAIDQPAQAGGAGQQSAPPQQSQSIADKLQKLLLGISPVSQAQAADLGKPQAPSTGAAWDPARSGQPPSIDLPQLRGGPSIEMPQLKTDRPSITIEPPGSEAVSPEDKMAQSTRAGNFQDPTTLQYSLEHPERPAYDPNRPPPIPRPRPSVIATDANLETPPATTAAAPPATTRATTKADTVPGGTPVRSDTPAPDAVTAATQQGQRAQEAARQNRPGSPFHRAISALFGGGELGDLVASLMLQLGVPAALIMAGRGRGGGRGFPLVGGRAAMGGRGGGRFGPGGRYIGPQPQYGRQLFPGSGVPNWLFPMIAGQALDRPSAGETDSQGNPLHPATGLPPGAKYSPDSETGAIPPTLSGGSSEGATPVKTVPATPPSGSTPPTTQARGGPDLFSPTTLERQPPDIGDQMERVPPSRGGQYVPPAETPEAQSPIQALMTGQGGAGQIRAPTQQDISATRILGSDTKPTAGFSSYLRNQRAPFMREMAANPQLKLQVAAIASFETPHDPMGAVEALMNRAALTNSTLQNRIWFRDHHGRTFYGPINAGLLNSRMIQLRNNPQELAKYYNAIDTVGQGTNLLGGATDQGSGSDPNVHNPSGRVIRSGETYNDWFPQAAIWRRRQQAEIARERQQPSIGI